MNIVFFGSSDYCLPIVETLKNNFNLISIITKKDQTVEKFAQSHNIKTYTPANKQELLDLKKEISTLKPDLAVVADYGLLIPKEIFSIPRYRTLNIHFSLLPKLRGPSPVQYTLLYGEKSAWISIIIMNKEMDTGDILWQKEVPITGTETTESLYKTLFRIAAEELPNIINDYANHRLTPIKQDHSKATYTKHFSREDGFIPLSILDMAIQGIDPDQKKLNLWSLSSILFPFSDTNAGDSSHPYQLANLIDRACRALSPWPGMWTEIVINQSTNQPINTNNTIKKRLKILAVHLETVNNLPLRYTSSNTNVVGIEAKSNVKLVLDEVQLEGKKPVSWKQFLQGYPDFSF